MSVYTYLTNVTEQIWLPECKYKSHSPYAKLAYKPEFLHKYAKTQN